MFINILYKYLVAKNHVTWFHTFADFYHSQISSKYTSIRELSQSTSTSTTEVKEEAVENEKPITFTKSKAFKSKPTFINPRHEESRPRFQDLSILVSLSSFMLWFFVLREENDLDVEIGRSLYDRIDGLEKANILTSIRYEPISLYEWNNIFRVLRYSNNHPETK